MGRSCATSAVGVAASIDAKRELIRSIQQQKNRVAQLVS